ncbi:MAG: hypothetical protein AAGG51_10270 [Cyanobacteria bacterium P01_G01_bin.54]
MTVYADRFPACGNSSVNEVPTPFTELGSVFGVISIISGVAGAIALLEVSETGVVSIGGITISGGAFTVGLIGGFIAGLIGVFLIGFYAFDRCFNEQEELVSVCIAGVIQEIIPAFESTWHEIFPFSAMHPRVDLVVKSRYWDLVEAGGAKVFCTGEEDPRRSEIIRCYYFSNQVCDAARGALIGATVGAVAGAIAGALAAAAIGCSSIVFCVLGLIIAMLIAAALTLGGAAAGGQIAKGGKDEPTTESDQTLSIGDLITVRGDRLIREEDDSANVLWWETSTNLHGRASSSISSNPFSYCDIEESFEESCDLP